MNFNLKCGMAAAFLLASATSASSVDVAISALPAAGAVAGADLFPCVQSGTTNKCTVTGLFTAPTISAFELGAAATDTTFARTGAGAASIEGKQIKRAGRRTTTLYGRSATLVAGGAIAACSPIQSDSGSNDIMYSGCQFSNTTDQAAWWVITPPKSTDESVDLAARVDWTSPTTTDATDDVIFTFACVSFGNDDSINGNAFPTADTVTDTQTAAGDFLSSAEITTITPAGTWAENDALICQLTRDADAGGDNFNGNAIVMAVQLYFTDNGANDD